MINLSMDQFKHDLLWRDGIRLGFHHDEGSHGRIMGTPADGQGFLEAQKAWGRYNSLFAQNAQAMQFPTRTMKTREFVTMQNIIFPVMEI